MRDSGCCGFASVVAIFTSTELSWSLASPWAPRGGWLQEPIDARRCRELCEEHEAAGCDVWTLRDGDCWLKSRLTCAEPPCLAPKSVSARSGQRACGAQWLPFGPAKAVAASEAIEHNCSAGRRVYGVVAAGSCADAELLRVFGPEKVIADGVEQGWWHSNSTHTWPGAEALQPFDLRLGCRERCDAHEDCHAANFFELGRLRGLCLLVREVHCKPAFGAWAEATSVFKKGCPPSLEIVPDEERALPISCGVPQCQKPFTEGRFYHGDWVPTRPAGEECYYNALSSMEARACTADTWIVIAGGSNSWALGQFIAAFHAGGSRNLETTITQVWVSSYMRGLPVFDVVVNSAGTVIYQQSHTFKRMSHRSLASMFDLAPAAPGGTRITVTMGLYWEQVAIAYDAVGNHGGTWSRSQRIYWSQSIGWYDTSLNKAGSRSDLHGLNE